MVLVWEKRLCNVLVALLVVAHTALALIDVAGVVRLADFMIRPDGSQQDPNDMLPVEKILVTMIAFPFLVIVLVFFFCGRQEAALVSAATHSLYSVHQIVHYKTWQALFHPKAGLTMEFFILSKLVWVSISMLIWFLSLREEKHKLM